MDKVSINSIEYSVKVEYTANRSAVGRLRDKTIEISIPKRWSQKDKAETYETLLKRSIRAISRGRWTSEGSKKITFRSGQVLKACGKEFLISISDGARFSAKISNGRISATAPRDDPERELKIAAKIKKVLTSELYPLVKERVDHFNRHFNADIRNIRITDTLTLWGTCSHDNKKISLNFRLLFMPGEVLDYVIVHELAHTKYKSHGKRFWGLVAKIIPDYDERRKWLRENGWSVFSRMGSGQQKITQFF